MHHGNGTQWAFYDDPTVLFVSSHQYPFYPGTGGPGDIGKGAGYGFTVNLAIEAGATDEDLWLAYHRVALPVLDQFKPELVLISAGFDGHQDDPLGGWRATTQGFAQLMAALVDTANVHAGGRVVAVTEGGYDLAALHACLTTTVEVLDDRLMVEQPTATPDAAVRGARAVAAVTPGLSRIWTL